VNAKGNTLGSLCFRLVCLLALSGCTTTAWRDSPSFYRTTQTALVVESVPSGKVYVNDQYIGLAPVMTSVDYEQEIKKKTRKVSYWITQPGLESAITLLSLGLYLPFSAIPVDIETIQEPTSVFRDNEFIVRVEAPGYKGWQETVKCIGENQVGVRPVLTAVE
jgi:hypothetical protein